MRTGSSSPALIAGSTSRSRAIEINASTDQALECVLVHSDGEAIAINLDIKPVEKPETVLWEDPIHRDAAAKK